MVYRLISKMGFFLLLITLTSSIILLFLPTFRNSISDLFYADAAPEENVNFIGVLLAIATVCVLLLSLLHQISTSQHQKFENRYFSLIEIHRENLKEVAVKDINEKGRRIFVLLIREYRIIWDVAVDVFRNSTSLNDKDLLNISYLTLFYGLGPNSTRILKGALKNYHSKELDEFIRRLNLERVKWNKKKRFGYNIIGGHQSRLGHYYRHLFQSFRYVNTRKFLSKKEKYSYGKLLRAQLSNHEQALLMLNVLSDVGKPWKDEGKLITTFRIIKNIPKDFFNPVAEFNPKHFFPKLTFEYEET